MKIIDLNKLDRTINSLNDKIKSKYATKDALSDGLSKKANSSHGTHVTWATSTPKANGTAAIGSASRVAREDHVHPLQTSVSGSSGSCTGNAATATKLATARTLTIGATGKTFNGSGNVSWSLSEIGAAASDHTHNYAGSSSAGGAANSVKTKLTIKLNGGSTEETNLFTFNGSSAKTINITPSSIGASASSHTHSYLPLSGGTLTGRLTASGKLSLPSSGSNWISGMTTSNASINITTQQTEGSYHPVLGATTYSSNVVNLGGINNDFGFYGYDKGRTTNGIDWSFYVDTANKDLVLNRLDMWATDSTGYFGALVLQNNKSLYGYGTGGTTPYNICGIDNSNNLYFGWGAETRSIHRNPTYIDSFLVMRRSEHGYSCVWDMYTNPNRLEIFWADGNGDNWNWNNKFYFDVNGQFYAAKQVSIGGHRITPYSGAGVSIINPDGSEFSGLEVKELWLGPYSGATYKFTVSPSAPSSPTYGTVWVQNG